MASVLTMTVGGTAAGNNRAMAMVTAARTMAIVSRASHVGFSLSQGLPPEVGHFPGSRKGGYSVMAL
jgi:hypothetical protein